MKLMVLTSPRVSRTCFSIALVVAWSAPLCALGLSDIKADDINLDLSAGEFSAKGKVKIDSDELKLSADEVRAKVSGTQILSITAKGKPLLLEMEIDDDEDGSQTFNASSHNLTFNNEENWVEFIGDAQLQTDIADIHAHKIRIDLDSQKITATKGDDGKQVKITLRNVETP